MPAPTYSFFIDILLDTIREDIADCCEKAYKSLPKVGHSGVVVLAIAPPPVTSPLTQWDLGVQPSGRCGEAVAAR